MAHFITELVDQFKSESLAHFHRNPQLTRQRALSRLRDSLEQQVVERTEELSQANLSLQDEVSRHRQARDKMRDLRNLLENIVDLMPSQLTVVDTNEKVVLWNQQMMKATGIAVEDALGQPIKQVHPELSEWLKDSRDQILHSEIVVTHKHQGFTNPSALIDIVAYPLSGPSHKGVVIRIDDVTERAKWDEYLIHAEKLASVGALAAGMAHEINNPLAGISQSLQVIKQRLNSDIEANNKTALKYGISMQVIQQYFEDRKIPLLFDRITESIQKATKIVYNIQHFSREIKGSLTFCSLSELLDSAVDLVINDCDLQAEYDFTRIRIVRDYEKNFPQIECQANLLQQVFLNILKNAAQAMRGKSIDNESPQITLRIKKGKEQARIEIQDNGSGMTEAVRNRVFEPFYTTRRVGAGTGLGLSIAYMVICDKHHGSIVVESSIGKGSLFIIKLPWNQRKDNDRLA